MSSFLSRLCALLACVMVLSLPLHGGSGEPIRALAELTEDGAFIVDEGGTVRLHVPMSIAVPWRVTTLDGPPRLVVEFNELNWSRAPENRSPSISDVQTGPFTTGWSHLVAVLREPLQVSSAEMSVSDDGTAALNILLTPTTAGDFRAEVEAQAEAAAALPLVVIDPGHGGVDPGAETSDLNEADLMLAFARVLADTLRETGQFDVVLTREADVFVPLEARVTTARQQKAAVFLSLHADALDSDAGEASGMTVYTLSETSSHSADRKIAERHAGTDILSGADLSEAEDDVALALLDIARRETAPRSLMLGRKLVQSFRSAGLDVNSRAERSGNFSVLKAAEIPSVLVELGFLSSDADRARLASPEWQLEAALAIRDALLFWADEDRLLRASMRR